MAYLKLMHDDGLLTLTDQELTMTEQGRLFTLAVCQVFDHYFAQEKRGGIPITHAI